MENKKNDKTKTICFVGGGTLGPVTPLLAVAEAARVQDPAVELMWIGTPQGPERELVEKASIPFFSLPVARIPRSFSAEWIAFPLAFAVALWNSYQLLKEHKPGVIATAGGYTCVPVVLIAKLLGIPSWVHQLDQTVLLTNKITAPFASWLTVAWPNLELVFGKRADVIGNPVRDSILGGEAKRGIERFGLNPQLPTVLAFGGGTGAVWLNQQMEAMGVELSKTANVIHVTGKGKGLSTEFSSRQPRNYKTFELLTGEMADAYAAADLVIGRAGAGTISELAALGKPAILIPIPRHDQETNARYLLSKDAILLFEQTKTASELLLGVILELLSDSKRRTHMGESIKDTLRTNGVSSQVANKLLSLSASIG